MRSGVFIWNRLCPPPPTPQPHPLPSFPLSTSSQLRLRYGNKSRQSGEGGLPKTGVKGARALKDLPLSPPPPPPPPSATTSVRPLSSSWLLLRVTMGVGWWGAQSEEGGLPSTVVNDARAPEHIIPLLIPLQLLLQVENKTVRGDNELRG